MKNSDRKNNLIKLVAVTISEVLCFICIRINLISYDTNNLYSYSMNIVQGLYFLPILISSLYILFYKEHHKKAIINATVGLIIYSIILHFFIRKIAGLFTGVSGIINFVEYASKIYFICLPLAGFKLLAIKKETIKNSFFIIVSKIALLNLISIVFNNLFELKGLLYSWPLSELVVFFITFHMFFKK